MTLTDAGRELRKHALTIPPAIIKRLGMSIGELEELHSSLTRVIAAAHETAEAAP